jgi:hypothetical protein
MNKDVEEINFDKGISIGSSLANDTRIESEDCNDQESEKHEFNHSCLPNVGDECTQISSVEVYSDESDDS